MTVNEGLTGWMYRLTGINWRPLKTLDGKVMVVALESSRENAVNLFHSGIFIFSMKNMFIYVIGKKSQAFELLVFHTDTEQNTTSHTACCDWPAE